MKRYLLFMGMCYYPSGGWWEFTRDADALEEARYRPGDTREGLWGEPDWWHVVDTESKQIVAKSTD